MLSIEVGEAVRNVYKVHIHLGLEFFALPCFEEVFFVAHAKVLSCVAVIAVLVISFEGFSCSYPLVIIAFNVTVLEPLGSKAAATGGKDASVISRAVLIGETRLAFVGRRDKFLALALSFVHPAGSA